jgi:hypothetical protein
MSDYISKFAVDETPKILYNDLLVGLMSEVVPPGGSFRAFILDHKHLLTTWALYDAVAAGDVAGGEVLVVDWNARALREMVQNKAALDWLRPAAARAVDVSFLHSTVRAALEQGLAARCDLVYLDLCGTPSGNSKIDSFPLRDLDLLLRHTRRDVFVLGFSGCIRNATPPVGVAHDQIPEAALLQFRNVVAARGFEFDPRATKRYCRNFTVMFTFIGILRRADARTYVHTPKMLRSPSGGVWGFPE